MSYAFELLQATNDSFLTILSIHIRCGQELVFFVINLTHLSEPIAITYNFKEDDTLIKVTEHNKRLVKDKYYIDVVCEDLLNILTNARIGEDIEISIRYDEDVETVGVANRVYEQFKIHSQTTKNPIYARLLHLQIENVSQLRSVLTYFNPTKLKKLQISNKNKKPDDLISIDGMKQVKKTLDFKSIVKMDHWKNAMIIGLNEFFVSIPFESFSHFEYATMEVSSISADNVQTLVNIISNSSCFKCFQIFYNCLNENVTEQFLDSLIGEKRIDKSGKLVRLIGNEIMFIHVPEGKHIFISIYYKKKDESIETPKALTSLSSKSAMLCLSNLLIMEKIVQHLDFAELIVLRRVSRGSRQCVDLLKPDPKLVAIQISAIDGFTFTVEVFGRNNWKTSSYFIPGEYSDDSINNVHFIIKLDMKNMSDDLIRLLEHQKTALKELCVKLDTTNKGNTEYNTEEYWELTRDHFTEMFKTTLSLRGTLLAVEKLNLTATCLTRATQILEHLDPDAIKTIEIQTISSVKTVQFINNLANLEQWTKADELKVQSFVVECDIEKLVHFSKVDIFLCSISLEDVLYLKEKFLSSTDFRQFKSKFVNTDANDSIFEDNFLGEPFRRVDDISSDLPDVWFFQYAGVMDDLQIRYYRKAKEFMFKRVPRR